MKIAAGERLLVAALKASPTVTTAASGRVATRLGSVFPAIRVTALGGAPRPTVNTGQVEFQIEAWGAGGDPADEAAAADLAQSVESAVEDGELVGSFTAGRVLGAYTFGNVIHSPDPTTSRERYILSLGLLVQP